MDAKRIVHMWILHGERQQQSSWGERSSFLSMRICLHLLKLFLGGPHNFEDKMLLLLTVTVEIKKKKRLHAYIKLHIYLMEIRGCMCMCVWNVEGGDAVAHEESRWHHVRYRLSCSPWYSWYFSPPHHSFLAFLSDIFSKGERNYIWFALILSGIIMCYAMFYLWA